MSKIQKIVVASCLFGYLLIYQAYVSSKTNQSNDKIGFCIFKKATNIPCPSCGSTRALLLLIDGDIKSSIYKNPLGCLIFIYLLIVPFWLCLDLLLNKKSLDKSYLSVEALLRRKKIFIPLILLLILNWIWNISKGL
jgi:hypothetical protein